MIKQCTDHRKIVILIKHLFLPNVKHCLLCYGLKSLVGTKKSAHFTALMEIPHQKYLQDSICIFFCKQKNINVRLRPAVAGGAHPRRI